VLERNDERYRRARELHPVGPVLFVGLERHQGESCALGDGTRLEPGAWLGRLHFNNARAAALQANSRAQAGVRFARLLRDSLRELAQRAQAESRLRDVAVFEGVTWLRAHGSSVGFEADPLPEDWHCRLLTVHFRLLIWAFAPVVHDEEIRPHRFRITRQSLIERFGPRPVRTGAVRPAP
jgi:hypothetical protein